MDQTTTLPLSSWQNFYVIVGTSAGALTGLQFVVISLIGQTRAAGSMREIRAFGTPTVTHFGTALLVSVLMTAPWQALAPFGVCLAACGVLGLIYGLTVIWHARKSTYKPDLEDWIWYTGLPLLAHLALTVAAIPLWWNLAWPLAVIAADVLLFLLLGVHNSWDTVTFVVLQQSNDSRKGSDQGNHQP